MASTLETSIVNTGNFSSNQKTDPEPLPFGRALPTQDDEPEPEATPTAASYLAPGCSETELGELLDEILVQLPLVTNASTTDWVCLSFWFDHDTWTCALVDAASSLVEMIRRATEVLIWDDRHDRSLFDLFCEKHVLAAFVDSLRTQACPNAVAVQLLQTLLILIQNIHHNTSFYYLLSGGLLSTLFQDPPNFKDEETLTYFAAILKGLALRLDDGSACLCLVAATGSAPPRLPAMECAIRLTSHKEAMVRTAARSAVLRLLTFENPEIRTATEEAFSRLLAPELARSLHVAWAKNPLGCETEDVDNLCGFMADLLALKIPTVTEQLSIASATAHTLMDEAIAIVDSLY